MIQRFSENFLLIFENPRQLSANFALKSLVIEQRNFKIRQRNFEITLSNPKIQ